ncbi:hypothetical protein niasHT_034645 [Heterodera trifolii]|uniref:Uncharacterized protein n=1 Tax=Heterodera trifolii TaxID=157864 RepID=A0ABD2J2Z7_9BILA
MQRTPLWDKWFCKENAESKCHKTCTKCQKHYANCHNAKCKENCEKGQNYRGKCLSECNEHSKECQEWKEIAEKILALLLLWNKVKMHAKHSAAKQIEEASMNGNCDGKCEKLITEQWHKSMLDTLLTDNSNDYMEFIQQDDHAGTSADSSFTLNLHLALKTVEQANVALMEGQKMPGLIRFKDLALYEAQMNKWNCWLTGSDEDSVEEEVSNNGTTDANNSPKMAQTSAMDIKNLAPNRR